MELNSLNLDNEEFDQEKEIFEEEEKIKEFDKINQIRYRMEKQKLKLNLMAILQKIFIFLSLIN